MDGSSPAHRDFQVYDTLPYKLMALGGPMAAGQSIDMFKKDMEAHAAEEAREPTEEDMNHMVDDLRMQFRALFGEDMYKSAVSDKQRDETEQRMKNRQ